MEGDSTSMNNQKSINSRIQMKVGRALLALSFALFLAAGDAAQAAAWYVNYNGAGWVADQIAPGDYVSVAGRQSTNGDVYASKNGAGVDLISGGVAASLGLSTNYKSLSVRTDNLGFMYGVNTSGGVDYLNWSGTWASAPLVSGNYLSVSTNTNGNGNVYASKASGGIDWITYTGGPGTGWAPSSLLSTSTVFKDIAPQYGNNGMMWAVTSTGAIAKIDYTGAAWVETPIVSGNYLSVANSGANGFAFGARADGGIDYITYGSSWGASTLLASSTVYTDLAADLRGNNFMYAASIPEPSTLSAFLVGAGLLLTLRFTRKGRVQG